MIVCKFGGSSLANKKRITNILNIIKKEIQYNKIIVIFSAIGNTTDLLLECGKMALKSRDFDKIISKINDMHDNVSNELFTSKEILSKVKNNIASDISKIKDICNGIYLLKDFSDKTSDNLLSYGEILSNKILYFFIKTNLLSHTINRIDTRDIIKTNSNFKNAQVKFKETKKNIVNVLNNNFNIDVYVATGFIASDMNNNTTTLGRGGSDYTASIFGSCINSKRVEIWTDVNGIMTCNPKKVLSSYTINNMSYIEMMNLSHYGANVIYTPTILPLLKNNIPIHVKNTTNPENSGTIITNNYNPNNIATAITYKSSVAVIKVFGYYLINNIGFSQNLFGLLSRSNINIIMISQSSSEYIIYIVINFEDLLKAQEVLNEEYNEINDINLKYYNDHSVITIVTNNNRNILKISDKIYNRLSKYNINILTQTTSDSNISLVIEEKYMDLLLNDFHQTLFFKDTIINLFLIGIGLIGSEVINQLNKNPNIKLIGIANSKKVLINKKGIKLDSYKEDLLNIGVKNNMDNFVNEVINLKLCNSVVVDCTASNEIYLHYIRLLKNNISLVTPNKKANSEKYSLYSNLIKYPGYFYETTVGAGLPVIETIKNIVKNGDKIIRIEAILSGTLSYIFNKYCEGKEKFSDIVKKAQELGFTEPNPVDDLSGMDVCRKILILSRIIGLKKEIEDVENNQLLSEECLNSKDVNSFYSNLLKMDKEFNFMREKAGVLKLKHIAKIENGKLSVGLDIIDSDHPFYNLKDNDNIVSIQTEYYKNPLVICGAGAGAQVTAAGVITDIYKSIS